MPIPVQRSGWGRGRLACHLNRPVLVGSRQSLDRGGGLDGGGQFARPLGWSGNVGGQNPVVDRLLGQCGSLVNHNMPSRRTRPGESLATMGSTVKPLDGRRQLFELLIGELGNFNLARIGHGGGQGRLGTQRRHWIGGDGRLRKGSRGRRTFPGHSDGRQPCRAACLRQGRGGGEVGKGRSTLAPDAIDELRRRFFSRSEANPFRELQSFGNLSQPQRLLFKAQFQIVAGSFQESIHARPILRRTIRRLGRGVLLRRHQPDFISRRTDRFGAPRTGSGRGAMRVAEWGRLDRLFAGQRQGSSHQGRGGSRYPQLMVETTGDRRLSAERLMRGDGTWGVPRARLRTTPRRTFKGRHGNSLHRLDHGSTRRHGATPGADQEQQGQHPNGEDPRRGVREESGVHSRRCSGGTGQGFCVRSGTSQFDRLDRLGGLSRFCGFFRSVPVLLSGFWVSTRERSEVWQVGEGSLWQKSWGTGEIWRLGQRRSGKILPAHSVDHSPGASPWVGPVPVSAWAGFPTGQVFRPVRFSDRADFQTALSESVRQCV